MKEEDRRAVKINEVVRLTTVGFILNKIEVSNVQRLAHIGTDIRQTRRNGNVLTQGIGGINRTIGPKDSRVGVYVKVRNGVSESDMDVRRRLVASKGNQILIQTKALDGHIRRQVVQKKSRNVGRKICVRRKGVKVPVSNSVIPTFGLYVSVLLQQTLDGLKRVSIQNTVWENFLKEDGSGRDKGGILIRHN